MKFISWNIDSLNAALTSNSARAQLSKDVLNKIKNENPDVIAFQETKLPVTGLSKAHITELLKYFPDYNYTYITSEPPAKKGYAGTMTLYKNTIDTAITIIPTLNAPSTMDNEGRLLTVDFGSFYFVNVYTPNSGGSELNRLDERIEWDKKYAEYLSSLDKPVIACGDFNVAHNEIDLAHPNTNHLTAGFTNQERDGFTNLLNKGFIDTFRYLHKDEIAYTWWTQINKLSKVNNVGWRLDYFLVNDSLKNKVVESYVMDSGTRQDHAPIVLNINI